MNTTIINHIEMRPSALGIKPCIAGTRIRVEDIYVWHILQGQSPEEIVANFPQLTMADVHAALAFYWDNREAMHEMFERVDAFVQKMKEEAPPSLLRQKMREKGLDPDTLPS